MTKIGLQVYLGSVVKADIGQMNAGQQQTDKATQYHWENPKVAQSFPVTEENMSHQEN